MEDRPDPPRDSVNRREERSRRWTERAYWEDQYPSAVTIEFIERWLEGAAVDIDVTWPLGWARHYHKQASVSDANAPALRVLDAGCGISVLPHALGMFGCQVTAVDFAESAICLNEGLVPHRAEWIARANARPRRQYERGALTRGEYESRSIDLSELVGSNTETLAGRVHYLALDWFDAKLATDSFDIITVVDVLKWGTKEYRRSSMERFRDLLAPEGLLYLFNRNAVRETMEARDLAVELGLFESHQNPTRAARGKRFFSFCVTG